MTEEKFADEMAPIMDPMLKMIVELAAEPIKLDTKHVCGVLSKALGEAFAIGWREGQMVIKRKLGFDQIAREK